MEEEDGDRKEEEVEEKGEVESRRVRHGWNEDDCECAQNLSHEVCGVIISCGTKMRAVSVHVRHASVEVQGPFCFCFVCSITVLTAYALVSSSSEAPDICPPPRIRSCTPPAIGSRFGCLLVLNGFLSSNYFVGSDVHMLVNVFFGTPIRFLFNAPSPR